MSVEELQPAAPVEAPVPVVGPPSSEAPAVPEASAGTEAPPAAEGVAAVPVPDDEAKPDKVRVRRGKPRDRLDELVVGTPIKGKVVGLAKFGAFVDIGAVTDGLVHLTEFSQKRVSKVEDAVQMGDEVEVWIKDVDAATGRISLSMRHKAARPMTELRPGDVLTGAITSATKYGVFVDIGAETEGLVHISEMSSGFVEKPGDIVKSGEVVEVRIKEIDLARERISLSMVGLANDQGMQGGPSEGHDHTRAAEEVAPPEPEERMPTVVELALRKALGQLQEESVEAPAPQPAPREAAVPDAKDDDTLGEVYERMLAAYRAEKAEK